MVNENSLTALQNASAESQKAPDGGPTSQAHKFLKAKPVLTVLIRRPGVNRPVKINKRDFDRKRDELWVDEVEQDEKADARAEQDEKRARVRIARAEHAAAAAELKAEEEERDSEEAGKARFAAELKAEEEEAEKKAAELPARSTFTLESEDALKRRTIDRLKLMPEWAYVAEPKPKAKDQMIDAILAVRADSKE